MEEKGSRCRSPKEAFIRRQREWATAFRRFGRAPAKEVKKIRIFFDSAAADGVLGSRNDVAEHAVLFTLGGHPSAPDFQRKIDFHRVLCAEGRVLHAALRNVAMRALHLGEGADADDVDVGQGVHAQDVTKKRERKRAPYSAMVSSTMPPLASMMT